MSILLFLDKLFVYCAICCTVPDIAVYSQLYTRVKLFSDTRTKQKMNGYQIYSQTVTGKKFCSILCHGTKKCQSFNFCSRNLCELNFAGNCLFLLHNNFFVQTILCEQTDDCFCAKNG